MKKTDSEITTTKKLVGTAVFSALAYVVSWLEFPIFPGASFLKLDFSLVFILLAGFLFGPISGVCASLIKELIRFFTSSTGGVGEIANFIVTVAFIIVPTIVYSIKKGLPTVIITLIIGSVLEIIMSLLANRFINFPLYMGESAKEMFNSLWYFIVLFNLIKTASVCVLTILLYKRISKFIKGL